MKLISLNIELDKHLDLVIPFLKNEQPDVVCLQELMEKDVADIAAALDYAHVFQASSYSNHHSYPEQMGKRQGVGIFAKTIATHGSEFYLGMKEHALLPFEAYAAVVPDVEKERAMVWADIPDETGTMFRIATAHLPVTPRGQSTSTQLDAAEKLLTSLAPLGEIVFCGDMNAPRGKETFSLLAARYTDAIPAEYTMSIDCDIHRAGAAIRADNEPLMVDGLFLSPSYAASEVHLASGVSDHMAIVADVQKK